jgi:hypothetical protein
MKILRAITFIVPIASWLIHIFIVVPLISMEKGDMRYIVAFVFFMMAGSAMIICLIISLIQLRKGTSSRDFVAVLLNLSWLYYLKVILYGPTIGYL